MNNAKPQVVVAQLGARMHYAVPRILHEAGMLAHFYTDICATKGWPRFLRAVPSPLRQRGLRRLLGRVPHGVPAEKTTAFSFMGLRHALTLAASTSASAFPAKRLEMFIEFGQRVVANGFGLADATYTFNCAGLEIMQAAKERGLKCIMEQTIAPAAVEHRLLSEESQRHPDWPSPIEGAAYAKRIDREAAEWQLADAILCGSEFVREGIAEAGGPEEKCVVVPYGVDTEEFTVMRREPHSGPMRLLTVGTIGIRKGTPYVLELARAMEGEAVFRLVGPGDVPRGVRERLPSNVELIGPVPRSEIKTHFAWADVFLLPSMCEGSATATYEALLTGLPVVCTPNTGSMVRDGADGIVVPTALAKDMVHSLRRLHFDRDCLLSMQNRANEQRESLSLEAYAHRLIDSLNCSFGMALSGTDLPVAV